MKQFILTFSFILVSFCLFAQVEPVGKDKVAIGGYDVVSYFNAGKAMKGDPTINTNYNTIIYRFISNENKEAFLKNPEAYLPQYDGYCALAVGAQNKKVSINPEEFKVTEGKLYLFFNGPLPLSGKKFNSVEPWNKDENNLIRKANTNWNSLKKKKK